MLRLMRGLGVLGLAVVLAACDSSGPAVSGDAVRLTLSVTSASATKSRTFTDGSGNALTIDRAEIILREIEFEREDDDDGCDGDDDGCEEVERGPVLVDVPLDSATPETVLETALPIGRWDEVEFEVHKLDRDDDDDRAFLDETGFPEDVSIRVEGVWTPAGGSDQSFTFISDLNEEQEIELEPPVEVTADQPANVTFRVDIDRWFRTSNGTLVNPARGNDDGDLEDLIEDNIEASIEAFGDDDRDGDEDDDSDDDPDDD
jgi:hypothetical protein